MRGARKTRREYYLARVLKGLCQTCGDQARDGHTRCAECARIMAIKERNARQERASKRAMVSTGRKQA